MLLQALTAASSAAQELAGQSGRFCHCRWRNRSKALLQGVMYGAANRRSVCNNESVRFPFAKIGVNE
jgi:hypothetical protein